MLGSSSGRSHHDAGTDNSEPVPAHGSSGVVGLLGRRPAGAEHEHNRRCRDRRNLAKPSQKVGGAAFTYTVTVTPLTRAPVQVAVGAQQTSTLAPRGTVRVFAFTAAKDADLDLEALVIAPADIDARLSLFHVGNKSWHGTNETPGALDAKLSGKMPLSGTYHAIVENVADYPTKLDFTFKITKK